MPSTKGLALEVRLSAYIDGEVDEAERKALEQLVSSNDEARLILEMLQAGNAFGDKAFEQVLHDPVPLSLVRNIKQGPGVTPKTERVVTTAKKRQKIKIWPRALAASTALLLIGGSTGFIIGKTSNDVLAPPAAAPARSWLDEIADYHRIYSRQTAEHQVEVRASGDTSRMRNWLVSSIGVDFTIPDLTARGLTFEGSRLLVASGRPVAQLVYKEEDGDIIAICLLKSKPGTNDSDMAESIRDDMSMISWQTAGTSYVVVGPSSDANLRKVAESTKAEI